MSAIETKKILTHSIKYYSCHSKNSQIVFCNLLLMDKIQIVDTKIVRYLTLSNSSFYSKHFTRFRTKHNEITYLITKRYSD